MPFSRLNLVCGQTLAALMVALVLATTSAAGTEKTVYTFCSVQNCVDGSYPESGVVLDTSGNLYGATNAGGVGFGTVFRLTPDSSGGWTESNVYSFTSLLDGDGPNRVIFDKVGNLYGTTIFGGGGGVCSNGGCGTVFELIPSGNGVWTKKMLFSFTGGNDGGLPLSGLIIDKVGNLYGTTSQGGAHGAGTVFELIHSASGWRERVIHSFSGGNDGRMPMSGLIFDKSENLFGTTNQGGTGNHGVVFRLIHTKQGWKEIVLHSFTDNGKDGAGPYAGSLVLDQAGNLYGTTEGGGTKGLGTVFELTRSYGFKEQVLYSFLGASDGIAPYTGVIIDAAGNLYGTTSFGGNGGDGTIFTLVNSGGNWKISVLHGFSGSDGSEPIGDLVFDGAGNFYGTAALGGANQTGTGDVFEMTP